LTDISFFKKIYLLLFFIAIQPLVIQVGRVYRISREEQEAKKVICRGFFFLWYYCYWERSSERAVHSSTESGARRPISTQSTERDIIRSGPRNMFHAQ